MQRFIRQFGQHNLSGLLGDREFIGEAWWEWLTNASIPYLIRIKNNRCSRLRKISILRDR